MISAKSLRRLKPEKHLAPLRRRAESDLPWVVGELSVGGPLLLDTTVYIDVLQGLTRSAVDRLLTLRTCFHSAVSLAELTHLFGRLDPTHPSTKRALKAIEATISDIPDHRLRAPGIRIWGEAGILAGEVFRLSGLPKNQGHERKYLNDAIVYLQAGELGATILSANAADFDFLNQIMPEVSILLYSREQAVP